MNCYFCNESISFLGKCQYCSTKDVIVIMYSHLYVHIYFDFYEIEIDITNKSTNFYKNYNGGIFDCNECKDYVYSFISRLEATPITPSNVKEKLLTYVLLS